MPNHFPPQGHGANPHDSAQAGWPPFGDAASGGWPVQGAGAAHVGDHGGTAGPVHAAQQPGQGYGAPQHPGYAPQQHAYGAQQAQYGAAPQYGGAPQYGAYQHAVPPMPGGPKAPKSGTPGWVWLVVVLVVILSVAFGLLRVSMKLGGIGPGAGGEAIGGGGYGINASTGVTNVKFSHPGDGEWRSTGNPAPGTVALSRGSIMEGAGCMFTAGHSRLDGASSNSGASLEDHLRGALDRQLEAGGSGDPGIRLFDEGTRVLADTSGREVEFGLYRITSQSEHVGEYHILAHVFPDSQSMSLILGTCFNNDMDRDEFLHVVDGLEFTIEP